ncbi:DHH family protein [Pseudomonas sp. ABC1]|uniref:DHH family protein n=1 Tax=Pseudomonas sp. ABC1 TaxID=2748080 RepID=UPI0015C2D336|nr:DHH family protein [Pseudomonas sp. ABC1]QLF91692.1 DHH family protein [Pseudomonas sp. ABC1]
MRVVTSGSAYLDIDAYACCIAYAELLNLQGTEARAVSRAPLNSTIPRAVAKWGSPLDDYACQPDDDFVLVDVSDYQHLDSIVVLDRVVEVIDHHPGFETYWEEKLGAAADIQMIGASATQVFLRWEAADLLPFMSLESASLLATAILDNTLNLRGNVTTACDLRAYQVLSGRGQLAVAWPEQYFLECQSVIEVDLVQALISDSKRMRPESLLPEVFAQITVWDAARIIREYRSKIGICLRAQSEDWVLNIISISEGKSYFLAESSISQRKLSNLMPLDWSRDVAVPGCSILRKELLRLALSQV